MLRPPYSGIDPAHKPMPCDGCALVYRVGGGVDAWFLHQPFTHAVKELERFYADDGVMITAIQVFDGKHR